MHSLSVLFERNEQFSFEPIGSAAKCVPNRRKQGALNEALQQCASEDHTCRLVCCTSCVLALSLTVPTLSFAQSGQSSPLTCSWPVVTTGSGITNVAFPDTDATYWTMPVDPTAWKAIIVTGEYPQTRFFSFTTYVGTLGKGDVVDSIVEANIAPDSGDTNPFQPGDSAGPHNYTISMSADSATSGNHLALSNSNLNYIVYRVYVPDKGLDPRVGCLSQPSHS